MYIIVANSWSDLMTNKPDTFCILPFVEFNLNPNGGVKPCCAFGRFVEAGGRAMSVYEHSVDDIWNSDDLRDTRRRMIAGEVEPACGYCNKMDQQGLRSLRLDANEMWENNSAYNPSLEKIPAIKERILAADFRLPGGGQMLNLDVGNLCNLKCRMCHSSASSMIANDPVHSKWSHVDATVARWKGAELVFAPRPVLGISYIGFSALDRRFDQDVIWCFGKGTISIYRPSRDSRTAKFSISVLPDNMQLKVEFDGVAVYDQILAKGTHELTFDIDLPIADEFEINFSATADSWEVSPIKPLFGVQHGSFVRAESGKSNVAFSRFPGGEQWFQNVDFLVKEVLANPDQIRQVNLVGGEPMLIAQCMTIIKHLVETGVSKNIVLSVTTNGMVLPDGWLELAASFRNVTLTFSLDGFGPISEYIRYPSVWLDILQNINKIKTLKNAYLLVNTTVQVYNMLHLVDMIKFCDEMKLEFRYHFLQGPAHLSPLVMPASVREEAAARIRRFAQRNDTAGSGHSSHLKDRNAWLMQLSDAFLAPQPNWDDKKLKEFMAFTNDLDDTRGQSFKDALPELHDMIVAAGFPWDEARRYSKVQQAS
jgi:MoaA/NifB/PqqE/SkfB family radical SAM enzyme